MRRNPSGHAALEDSILHGMAREIWLHAYVRWATEVEAPPVLHGGSWEESAPPVPAGALTAAKDFARGIKELNRLGAHPMAEIFQASRRYAPPQRGARSETDLAVAFGREVASACLGTLEVPEPGQYRLPQLHVSLDDDGRSLSWDEGWTWSNPARARSGDCSCHKPAARASRNPGDTDREIEEFDRKQELKRFATDVLAELDYVEPEPGEDGTTKGRYGERKVFIAALWRQLRKSPQFDGMTLEQFKARLLEAFKQRLLELARADFVGFMDGTEVAESETVWPGGYPTFHFVVDNSK